MEVDVAVLGGGPGGYIAAIRAARCKGRVHRACARTGRHVPSHRLHSHKGVGADGIPLKQAEETFEKLGVRFDGLHLEFAKVNAWKAAVVKQMTQGVAFRFKTNSVEWIKGTGTFKDANTIGVEGSGDVSFKSAIIATGSFPCARRSSGSSRIAALTPRDCSRRLRFPSVSSSSALGSSGASPR
jgi:dihydrolipoyl dehydrogenase